MTINNAIAGSRYSVHQSYNIINMIIIINILVYFVRVKVIAAEVFALSFDLFAIPFGFPQIYLLSITPIDFENIPSKHYLGLHF